MPYVPNATDLSQPTSSQVVESAALEFRTLKENTATHGDRLIAVEGDVAALDPRLDVIETQLGAIALGTDSTALAAALTSASSIQGASLVSVDSRTVRSHLKNQRHIQAYNVPEDGVTDAVSAVAAIVTADDFGLSGGFATVAMADQANMGVMREVLVKKTDGAIDMPATSPETFGNGYAAHYYGGQLKELLRRLTDPLCQSVNIAFIGDSITWGIGATASATTDPRDGTLSDPRDFYKTGSYVNNVKRYLRDMLGNGVSTALSNHPASPTGESIATYTKAIPVYPKGLDFTVTTTGSVTAVHIADAAALVNSKLALSCNPGAGNYVTIRFQYTGNSIELVFGILTNGGKYKLYVNGAWIGGVAYGVRTGDDGFTTGYSRSRIHTFPRVVDATVELVVTHYDNTTGVNAMYLEAIRVNKVVRVKNQGINGATATSYLTYNFPTARETGANYFIPGAYTGLTETPTGTTSVADRDAVGSLTGSQRLYGYAPSGASWVITLPVSATKPLLDIVYSSTTGGGDIQVEVASVVIATFSTNSAAPGGSAGYAKIKTITLPGGTTSVVLRSIAANYLGGAAYSNYLYIEGFANYETADLAYPSTNGFSDGVALAGDDDFAFIQLGTNDRIASSTFIESVSQLKAQLENMLALTPVPLKPILMVAPPAQNDTTPTYALGMQDIRNQLVNLGLKNNIDVIDNFRALAGAPFHGVTSDGLHPSDLGHKIVASNITNALNNAH